ncbi:hypothetical protein HY988_05225 [Candidatus Micrarchaeota archaeon]|nr:hypothetical protein [Candidatus Micrarchaeota archaeon]
MRQSFVRAVFHSQDRGTGFGAPSSGRPKHLVDCRILILERSGSSAGMGDGEYEIKRILTKKQVAAADRFRCGATVYHTEKLDAAVEASKNYDIVVIGFCEKWLPEMIDRIRQNNPKTYVVVKVCKYPPISSRNETIPEGIADLVVKEVDHRIDETEFCTALERMLTIAPLPPKTPRRTLSSAA